PDQVVVQGVLNSGAVASAQILSGAPTGSGLRWEIYGRTGRLTVTAASSLAGSALLVAVARGNGELIDSPVPAGYRTVLPDAAPMVRNVAACYAGLATAIRAGRPAEPDFGTATTLHRLLETI